MKLCLLADDPQRATLTLVAQALNASITTNSVESDAILVRGQSGLELVSGLIREGNTVCFVPESECGSDRIYRCIPVDEEFPDRLHAIWPLRLAPAVQELKRTLSANQHGGVLHLQMERVTAGGPSLTAANAEAFWLHDADLLRWLCGGEYRRVTAIHSGLSDTGISTASVSLSGEGVPDAMWALRSGAAARCELTLTTSSGAAVLTWDGTSDPTLTVNCKAVSVTRIGESEPTEWPATNPDGNLAPLSPDAGEKVGKPRLRLCGVTPWSDAVRAFDLLDAARRSLARRRTVELQFESTSERSQFKTHMTTVGCGLLLATMFGLIGLLFAGRMLDPRDAQQKQSEVAGFVLRDSDFSAGELNSHGQEKLSEIITHYQRRSATILIEPPADSTEPGESRRTLVVNSLAKAGMADAEVRTLVRPLKGVWFQRAMVLAWIILFLPLGIFLGLQLLLGVTPEDRHAPRRST